MTTATTSEQQKGRRGGVVQENELFISDIIETEDENHQPITVRVTIAPSPCPFRYAQGRVDADIKIYDSRKRLFRNKLGINTYVDIRNKIDERGANPFSIHYGDNDGELAVWLFGGGMGDMTDCAQVECDDFNHRDRCYQHLGLCEYPLNILEKMHQRVARMISDLKSPTSGQSLYPHVVVRPLKKEEVSKEMTAVARLVWITPNAEALIAQIARVSTSTTAVGTAATPDYERLLKYLISHQHWSPFEMATMCVEIVTTRAIAAQIIRHRSFPFQEFSQRYSAVSTAAEAPSLRRQDLHNRQQSIDDLDPSVTTAFQKEIQAHFQAADELYHRMLDAGVAKECARNVLPLATPTRLYMSGTIRSWIHYVALRGDEKHGAQAEHREIAQSIRVIMAEHLPVIASILNFETPTTTAAPVAAADAATTCSSS